MTPLARLRRLWTETKGLAAVEFAILMPVMVTAMLGTVEISNVVKSYSKAVSASQTVADLASQSNTLTTAQLDAIAVAAQRVLDPLSSTKTNLGIDVVSVGFDAQGNPSQLWRYQWGATSAPLSLNAAKGLGVAGDSVVMVRLGYICVPLLHEIVPSITFTETSVSRPRLVRKIALNGVTG
ncbi:Flp pilus assembly protein TadG [Candidatus Terasakiella magnetica]|nr:Flp pilus assembly protein TadG [Candidatus Terasakiella magnetica]